MNSTYSHWLLEANGKIATLTLNRPAEKNRIDSTTLSELGIITKAINDDPNIWVVILQGKGDCFSAGVDVSLIGDMMSQDANIYRKNLRQAQSFLDSFESINKPTIAALHGHVIGGGMILSLCCDFRIASENILFSLPEVKRSIGVIMGTQRITRTIGVAHTKEMVMLGNPVDADKALRIGLVNQVVPQKLLQERVRAFAEQFLELPPLAVGLCKQIINEGQFMPRSGQDLEIEVQQAILKTEDFKEAITSFFEKRKPMFKGR